MTPRPVLCVGGATVDRIGRLAEPAVRPGTSNIGTLRAGLGGVARNVAETLARLGVEVTLLTRLGADPDGQAVRDATQAAGVRLAAAPGPGRTATYTAILDGTGELVVGLADMAILEAIGPGEVRQALAHQPGDAMVFADANLDEATLWALALAAPGRLAAGPVSVQKAVRLRAVLPRLGPLLLNRREAAALLDASADEAPPALAQGLEARGVVCGVLTDGARGALVWEGEARYALPALPARVLDVNGAGDALAGATLAGLARGEPLLLAAQAGLAAAALTVEVAQTVRPDLSPALLAARLARPDPPETTR